MDARARDALVERYRAGYDAFAAALEGIAEDELDARPAPTEWTPREITHHLADAELRSAIRLRQLIAEDEPTIHGYDEELYTKRLHYDRPIATSLEAIRIARATSLELLEALSDDEWRRTGTHTESGPYSVTTWLEIYTAHAHDHAEQVRRARAAYRSGSTG